MADLDRAKAFRSFIAKKPDDPFPRYGLAMELLGQGDPAGAIAEFDHLLMHFPDYVPTYLMAGNTLATAGQRDRAIEVLRRGVATATRAGNAHAASELNAALAALTD